MIKLKRVYEEPSPDDGTRILVDRLWPRGLSKEKAQVDLWLKEVGPSTELRKWFGHDPAKWPEFQSRYTKELKSNPSFQELKKVVQNQPTITLLYGSGDTRHNQAVVLARLL